MSIKEWFTSKRNLRKENQALTEKIFAAARKYDALLFESEARMEKRNKQFRTLQNILADTVDIPLSAFSQEIAKIKQELGTLKATESRAEAELEFIINYQNIIGHIQAQHGIPYQEAEKLTAALEQIATANQELQQWSGEGEERHVKP